MSMYVDFELRIRGSRASCKDFEKNYLPNYDGIISEDLDTLWEQGTDDDYIMAFSRTLRRYICSTINSDLQYDSETLSLEMEIFGSDCGEPDVWEHCHYKNGDVLTEQLVVNFLDPSRYKNLTEEQKSMYREEDGDYILKDEYVKLRWIGIDHFECDFSASMERPAVE